MRQRFPWVRLAYETAMPALFNAVKSDPSYFVRHEAAVALGVIGF